MTIDPLFSLLVGALGATVVGGIGAFVGALFQSRREHHRWTREQRLDAYRDFLREAGSANLTDDKSEYVGYLHRFGMAYATVELLGPDEVMEAAHDHFEKSMDYVGASRRARRLGSANPSASPGEEAPDPELDRLAREQIDSRRAFVLAARKEIELGGARSF